MSKTGSGIRGQRQEQDAAVDTAKFQAGVHIVSIEIAPLPEAPSICQPSANTDGSQGRHRRVRRQDPPRSIFNLDVLVSFLSPVKTVVIVSSDV